MKQKEKERFSEMIQQILIELCDGIMVDCHVAQTFGEGIGSLEIKATYKDAAEFCEEATTGPIADMWKSSAKKERGKK